MPKIYDLKPRFQNLLHPVVQRLWKNRVTPNQITWLAFGLSVVGGACVAVQPTARWPFILIPFLMFIRMALNAIDGMLAREHDLLSPLRGLEALYQKYKDRNFVILGFPSNDFHQEFNDENKTSDVCYKNYGVTFPMFKSSPVRGDEANGFFKKLAEKSGIAPKWNFYKYLIDNNGRVVESYASMTTPEDQQMNQKIEDLLKTPKP